MRMAVENAAAPARKVRVMLARCRCHYNGAPVHRAKARIGHFTSAQILEAMGCDYIDESEVLTPADEVHHIDKKAFKVPFVCGARNLGWAAAAHCRRCGDG